MAQKTQKIIMRSSCFIGNRLFEKGGGYEESIETVKELRSAGRVARILPPDAELPKPEKETADSKKQAAKETASKK